MHAFLAPGTHLLHSPIVVDSTHLALRANAPGAVLDARGLCRHFLVQGRGSLELEGMTLVNGTGTEHIPNTMHTSHH